MYTKWSHNTGYKQQNMHLTNIYNNTDMFKWQTLSTLIYLLGLKKILSGEIIRRKQ